MSSTVRPRPNYYQLLGLTADATTEEIGQAFARSVGLFQRPLVDSAELAVAFETLRDPAKRRAYDLAHGLQREEPPTRKPPEVHVSVRFIGATAPPERTVGSVIAASLREPPKADPPPPPPPPKADEIPSFLRPSPPRPAPVAAEEPVFDWKRPAIALGGVIFGVGVLAAVAGWSAGLVDERDQAGAGLTVDVPKAKPRAAKLASIAPEARQNWVVEQSPRPTAVAAIAERHVAPSKRQPQAANQPDPLADLPVAQVSDTEAAPVEAAAATSQPPVEAEAASMPLPSAVIARTIGRIGYACGSVASTSPVEGASGVFKVTCTSGHSYQATPVKGRYHFRRLSDR